MSDRLLEVRNLSMRFLTDKGPVEVLHEVNLHVDRGESLVILGESGSGKSVTAAAIMDLLDRPPAEITGGEVLFEGKNLLTMSPAERQYINGAKISIIFQDPLAHLHPLYTVGRQITEAMVTHGVANRADARDRALALLRRVGIPDAETRIRHYAHQFSGGQRQRVMIAMAMVMRPRLLIADEPTTALDVTVQAEILRLLRETTAEMGMSVILITHDLSVAAHMGDRVAVMQGGRVVETGPTRQVFENPQHHYTRRLLEARPGEGANNAQCADAAETLLHVDDVHKDYQINRGLMRLRVIHAVRGASFDVRRGETVAIVGESGSGKSTLARLLMLLEKPTSGRIFYRGRNLLQMNREDQRLLRRNLQMVFQDPYSSLNPRLTTRRIITEPWTVHRDILPKERWEERVVELLSLVGLEPEHAGRYPHEFSGGQRQRIAIARALACEPELVICDEAVSALDLSIQAQVIALLADLRDRLGLSYIFISHDLHVVRHFANRVLVMKDGEVVEQGQTEEVFRYPRHAYTQRLVNATPRPKWDDRPASRNVASEALL